MSANYPAAAFMIMMVTTVLLVPSSAAPASHGSSSNVDTTYHWWYNACGHHSILHSQSKKHTNGSDKHIYQIVKNQLKIFHDFFKQELKNFKKMYAAVEPFDNVERKSFDWLPKYIKPKNSIRSKTALKELHTDLQYYVLAVNYLENIKLHSDAKTTETERNEAFVRVFNHIKSLICEVEAGVNGTDQTVDERIPPNYPLQKGLPTNIGNKTQLDLFDAGVLHKLKDFIQKWNNNFMKRLPKIHKRESESEDSDTMEIIDMPDENENSIE